MSLDEAVRQAVMAEVERQRDELEGDLARAIALQDFDRIDRITVVYVDGYPGPPPAVASLLVP